MTNIEFRAIADLDRFEDVITLQKLVWEGADPVPGHLLLANSNNGGLLIGAYEGDSLLGFVFGIVGLHEDGSVSHVKHHSHMLAVHPDHRDKGLGYSLKRAQWQLVRQQGIELITWTYDPLQGRNAFLNLSKLGGIVKTYERDVYGQMTDAQNAGVPSDRFELEWWVNAPRVLKRLSQTSRGSLDLANFLSAGYIAINQTKINATGFPEPYQDDMHTLDAPESRPPLVLFEIPPDFQMLRTHDIDLAREWRMYTRVIFELMFSHGYIATDFVHLPSNPARSYYVFSLGEATLGF